VVVVVKKKFHPDDRPALREAKRAAKLPRRPPCDDDRPRVRSEKPFVLDGQTSIFDFLDQADADARRSA
jgi:hypothetical protein